MIIRDLNYEIEFQDPYFEDGALRRLGRTTIIEKKTRAKLSFDELTSYGGRIQFKNLKPTVSRESPEYSILLKHITQACKSIIAAQYKAHGRTVSDYDRERLGI